MVSVNARHFSTSAETPWQIGLPAQTEHNPINFRAQPSEMDDTALTKCTEKRSHMISAPSIEEATRSKRPGFSVNLVAMTLSVAGCNGNACLMAAMTSLSMASASAGSNSSYASIEQTSTRTSHDIIFEPARRPMSDCIVSLNTRNSTKWLAYSVKLVWNAARAA